MNVKSFKNILFINEFSKINYTYLSSINALTNSINNEYYYKKIICIAKEYDKNKELNKIILDRSLNALSIDEYSIISSMDYNMYNN